jgi:ketosteroid isomerase-like protein
MRKLLLSFVAFVALAGCEHMHNMLGGGTAKAPPAPVVDTAADEAQIKALEDKFAAGVSAMDIDAIMSVYADDVFVFDIVPPRQYVGAAAYRQDWEDTLKGLGNVKFDISDLAVSSDGQLGYSHSIQHLTATRTVMVKKKKKIKKFDITVRVTDVYKKMDADWKIVQEHVSVPVNLTTNKPDLSSKP